MTGRLMRLLGVNSETAWVDPVEEGAQFLKRHSTADRIPYSDKIYGHRHQGHIRRG